MNSSLITLTYNVDEGGILIDIASPNYDHSVTDVVAILITLRALIARAKCRSYGILMKYVFGFSRLAPLLPCAATRPLVRNVANIAAGAPGRKLPEAKVGDRIHLRIRV